MKNKIVKKSHEDRNAFLNTNVIKKTFHGRENPQFICHNSCGKKLIKEPNFKIRQSHHDHQKYHPQQANAQSDALKQSPKPPTRSMWGSAVVIRTH